MAQAGTRVRVAISWDSHPSDVYPYNYGLREVENNLDLQVLRPDGTEAASSRSWNNNYEIVEFDAGQTTGNYTARVLFTPPFNVDSYEYVGLAYSLTGYYQPQFSIGQRLSNPADRSSVIYAPIILHDFVNLATGDVDNNRTIAYYRARASYPAAWIQILDVVGNANFTISDKVYGSGQVTFKGTANGPPPSTEPDLEVANLIVRLNGSAKHIDDLNFAFTEINSSPDTYHEPVFYWWYQRGDALWDIDEDPGNDVNWAGDAQRIAEYRVGIRELYELDAVSAAGPHHTDGGDVIAMTDAMFIAQYEVGLRDEWYNWIGDSSSRSAGQATAYFASSDAAASGAAKLPLKATVVNSTRGIGAYEINVTFDPKVISVDSVSPGDALFDRPPAVKIDSAKGLVRMAGYHARATGATGEKILAYLNVRPVAKAGAKTTLNIAVITLSDVLGNNVPFAVKAGTVTIK